MTVCVGCLKEEAQPQIELCELCEKDYNEYRNRKDAVIGTLVEMAILEDHGL